jgi:5'-nucleotidase (lipoprotein e(P4) family)
MPSMKSPGPILLFVLALAGCATVQPADERAAVGEGGKADGPAGVDVMAMLEPGVGHESRLEGARDDLGYVFYAEEGAQVEVEVTQRGSSRGFDSYLQIRGPRQADGDYPESLAADDEAGYGQLSRTSVTAPQTGFYLAQLSVDEEAQAEFDGANFRLLLSCDAGCVAPGPVAEMNDATHWARNSAEFDALSVQAYQTAIAQIEAMHDAGELPASWAVTFDADETLLSNAQFEKERAELGVGYSSKAWAQWVRRRAAPANPGAVALTQRIHELGGYVAVVTNRKVTECDATLENLRNEGIEPDGILCRTGSSDKSARWAMVEEGRAGDIPATTLVMWVGDNIHDFPGMEQESRFDGAEAFGDFGRRFIVIPNPMYGSWTRNARD